MHKVNFRQAAIQDLQEIVEYYDSFNPKLADVLMQEVEKAVHFIHQYPLSCQKKLGNIRVVFLKRFSYGIYFKIYNMNISIIAILHSSRNPKIWKSRKF